MLFQPSQITKRRSMHCPNFAIVTSEAFAHAQNALIIGSTIRMIILRKFAPNHISLSMQRRTVSLVGQLKWCQLMVIWWMLNSLAITHRLMFKPINVFCMQNDNQFEHAPANSTMLLWWDIHLGFLRRFLFIGFSFFETISICLLENR